MTAKEIYEQWQTARLKALSEMLDNPDEIEIYPNSKFFNRIDGLFMGYLTKHTNSKLRKIIRRIERKKEDYMYETSFIWGTGLNAAIKIILKELTKMD